MGENILEIFVEIIAAVLAVGGITFTINYCIRKNKIRIDSKNNHINDSSNNKTDSDTVIINGNNNVTTISSSSQTVKSGPSDKKRARLEMNTLQILFVDDENFSVIKMLKKMGWKNIKKKQDIISLNDSDLINSHVVFVDIKGVGREMGFSNEGIGLAYAIQNKYPDKCIVLYSGTHEHDIFDTQLQSIKYRLPKNAEPIQFNDILEGYVESTN